MFKSKFDLFLSTFCGFVHTEQAGRYHMRPTKKKTAALLSDAALPAFLRATCYGFWCKFCSTRSTLTKSAGREVIGGKW